MFVSAIGCTKIEVWRQGLHLTIKKKSFDCYEISYLDLVSCPAALEKSLDEAEVGAHQLQGFVKFLRVRLGPPIRRVSRLKV